MAAGRTKAEIRQAVLASLTHAQKLALAERIRIAEASWAADEAGRYALAAEPQPSAYGVAELERDMATHGEPYVSCLPERSEWLDFLLTCKFGADADRVSMWLNRQVAAP
jgi:hypothetical protein